MLMLTTQDVHVTAQQAISTNGGFADIAAGTELYTRLDRGICVGKNDKKGYHAFGSTLRHRPAVERLTKITPGYFRY